MTRPSWDDYFIEIAEAVSRRGTCDRKRCGAVLVNPKTRSILATGYNGSVSGEPHCDDAGHDMVDGWPCFKALMSAGVRRIVSLDVYRRDARVDAVAENLGILIKALRVEET